MNIATAVIAGIVVAIIKPYALTGIGLGAGFMGLVHKWLRGRLQIGDDVLTDSDMFTLHLAPSFQTFLVSIDFSVFGTH